MNRFLNLIVLVIVFIGLIKLFLPDPKHNKEESESFWSNKTHASSTYDIVACGDSRIYRGISDDIISTSKEKLSFLNLGYSSAGLSKDYLKFALSKFDPDANPKVLVVGITPHALTKEAFNNYKLNFCLKINGFEKFRFKYFSKYLKHIVPYKFKELINYKENNYLQRYDKSGWIASDKIIQDSTFALKSYKNIFSKYQVIYEDVISFVKNLNSISRSGVQVIAFRPPSTHHMVLLEDSISGFHEHFIREQLDSSILWLDFENSDFTSYDGSHLEENSARKLSKLIGDNVKW